MNQLISYDRWRKTWRSFSLRPLLLLLLLVSALTSLSPQVPVRAEAPMGEASQAEAPKDAVSQTQGLAGATFRNWVSYYGPGRGRIDTLSEFDLLDIELDPVAANYTRAEVSTLRSRLNPRGGKVLSYLNIGACETFRYFWDRRDANGRQVGCQAFQLAPYEGFPGEFWMDVRNPGFQDLIVGVVARGLVDMGADGFYLDNLDNFLMPLPGTTITERKQGVTDILRRLRQTYPDRYIVAQNGLYTLGTEPNADNVLYWPDARNGGIPAYTYVDAEAHEDVNSYPECPTRRVCRQTVMAALADLRNRGRPIFLLDYTGNQATAQRYYHQTICDGFLPYVADRSLQSIKRWDVTPPPAPDELTARTEGSRVLLTWQAAESCSPPYDDDFGVTSYRVFRDGVLIGQTYLTGGAAPFSSFVDESAPAGVRRYSVTAVDTGPGESTATAVTISVVPRPTVHSAYLPVVFRNRTVAR
ncbi:MAG: endo alpha-1,4 polygalactosaminidase [Chloroflexi bacterium]|nr:endo alpha-1,4 polygalactosaminidase [Chloroflexota bacterium]